MLQDLERLDQPPLVLTDTAAEIWSLLDGRSVEEIVAALVAVHEVEAEAIRPSVVAFLSDLAERGVVVTDGPVTS